jgi:hypothetical protein
VTAKEYAVQWTFGTFLWSTLVFFFWFAVIWMFISVFASIFRRDDLSGWAKAGWVLLIVLLPFLGVLIYLIALPKGALQRGDGYGWDPTTRSRAGYRPADEIATAAQLYDQGKISGDEYEYLKRQALAH